MHFGQIGLEQIRHLSMVNWPGCLGQGRGASEAAGADSAGSGSGARTRIRAVGGDWGADWAWGGADKPSSWRTRSLTKSDESSPQAGQTNRTGLAAISGVTSRAYFAPQEH